MTYNLSRESFIKSVNEQLNSAWYSTSSSSDNNKYINLACSIFDKHDANNNGAWEIDEAQNASQDMQDFWVQICNSENTDKTSGNVNNMATSGDEETSTSLKEISVKEVKKTISQMKKSMKEMLKKCDTTIKEVLKKFKNRSGYKEIKNKAVNIREDIKTASNSFVEFVKNDVKILESDDLDKLEVPDESPLFAKFEQTMDGIIEKTNSLVDMLWSNS